MLKLNFINDILFMNVVSQEFGQGMVGIVCLFYSGGSSGIQHNLALLYPKHEN